jgi:hypothetical protein
MEWKLAEEIEVLGVNPPQCHFVHHKPNMTWPGTEPGRRGGRPTAKSLRYGMPTRPSFSLTVVYVTFIGNIVTVAQV